MDPLKAAAATAFCLALFWLAFRLTRRLVDLAISAGRAEERRRAAEEGPEPATPGDAHRPAPSRPGPKAVEGGAILGYGGAETGGSEPER